MYIKANDYKPKEIYKFIRQSTNKKHKEFAEDIGKSEDWSKSNESGRNSYKFKDILELAKINNIEILIIKKD